MKFKEYWAKYVEWLFKPIDIAVIAYFRIAFGAIMTWEMWRYFEHGWIKRYWVDPHFQFSYQGFGWLEPWAGDGMYTHFYVMIFLALCIMFGFLYRVTSVIWFFGFAYIFLLDKTTYLNHFYLITIISFVMMFLPAEKNFSIDSMIFKKIKTNVVPNWSLWILRGLLGVVYFYGGLAKMNGDWLRGKPIGDWIAGRSDFPLVGHLFTEPWMGLFFAYSGMMLDLLIFPFLVIKRTRMYAFIFICTFHVMNDQLWQIGIFPWFMIAATAIFFEPESFRWHFNRLPLKKSVFEKTKFQHKMWPVALITGLIVFQCLFPFRHFFIPGNVSWTEEGHRFAWHMKLRDKNCVGDFFVIDVSTGQRHVIDLEAHLSERQIRKMRARPDMIIQFAKYLKDWAARAHGFNNTEIVADVMCSLNGRSYQALIDNTIDLSTVKWDPPNEWILPLTTPLFGDEEDLQGNL